MAKSALWAPAPKQKVTFAQCEGPGWTVSLGSEGNADCPICWYAVQFAAWRVYPVSSGFAGARGAGCCPGPGDPMALPQ